MEPTTPASNPQEPAPEQSDTAAPAGPDSSPEPPSPGPAAGPEPGLSSDSASAADSAAAPLSDPVPSSQDQTPPDTSEGPPIPIISQTLDRPDDRKPLPPPYVGGESAAPKPVAGSDAPAPGALPGGSVSPGGQAQPPTPVASPYPQPTVMVGDGGIAVPPSGKTFTPTDPAVAAPTGRKLPKLPKKVFIPAIVVLLLIGSASAFYFGYYNSPSFIYSESLKNTGTGYDRLVTYADQQSKLGIAGYSGSGTYSASSSSANVDGTMSFQDSQGNSDTTFSVGTQGVRVNVDARTIKSGAAEPDVYIKFAGIKGLGTMAGDPGLDPAFAKLDGKWIFIDHTFLVGQDKQSGQTNTGDPTREQLLDEARAFGQVNKEYLFSTAKDKAVTTVVKKVGKETIDGRSTYHYQIALQKDNVKKYILAQRDALEHSKLDAWLKQSHEESSVLKSFNDAADSTKNIKASDTYDIWMDTGQRIIYKVRYNFHPNPANNYVDYGLNYKGGSDYPFFISGKSQDGNDGATTYSFTTDINTSTNTAGFHYDEQTGGSDPYKLHADFNLKTSRTAINIARPTAGVISLTQAADDLGYGDLVSGSGGSQASTLRDALGVNGSKLSVSTIHDALLRQALNR